MILCLKAFKMISKVCLYNVVMVKDLGLKYPPLELIPVVKYFSEDLPSDLSLIPLKS